MAEINKSHFRCRDCKWHWQAPHFDKDKAKCQIWKSWVYIDDEVKCCPSFQIKGKIKKIW